MLKAIVKSMLPKNHRAIFVSDKINKNFFTQQLLSGNVKGILCNPENSKGLLFSKSTLDAYIEEELCHDHLEVATPQNRLLYSLSDGEQKKALLKYLLQQKPDFIILDNPFDNLDRASQADLVVMLGQAAVTITIIQLISRTGDLLPFIKKAFSLEDDNNLCEIENVQKFIVEKEYQNKYVFQGVFPPPIELLTLPEGPLITFKNVSVLYDGKAILRNISWTINSGECWQLTGPNGSGKTTILSLITGDNPKAYGQDITIFGRKKGSGEAVWEIKKLIGYFTPSISSRFSRYEPIMNMIIGGFFDSVGLYIKPSELQLRIASQWLQLLEILPLKNTLFHKLSPGRQRMALIARAMVKHPPLLILDEPTTGLDDYNAGLVISLINKIITETNTTVLFVSHRSEAGLASGLIYQLTPYPDGSTGEQLT